MVPFIPGLWKDLPELDLTGVVEPLNLRDGFCWVMIVFTVCLQGPAWFLIATILLHW